MFVIGYAFSFANVRGFRYTVFRDKTPEVIFLTRIIFHIDVNSAFLSWTSVENVKTGNGMDLRDIPAIIGGDQKTRHGVVLAKSVPAKSFGIHTGEPVVNALRKCPNLVMAPPNHALYQSYSRQMMDYLHSLTPDIEQVSIDECFLDFTGIAHRYDSPKAAACKIKDEIHSRFGFTVNVGISSNKLLAKMASDFEKPDKVHTLFPDEIQQKMWPLPVGELFMAGRSSVSTLEKLGIHTIGELACSDPTLLSLHLKSHGRMLWEYANGMDDSPVCSTPAAAKGVGNSTTLSKDLTTEQEAAPILHSLAESVASRLRKAHKRAGTVCVEIKYHDFQTFSRQMQLDTPTNSTDNLYRTALHLFHTLWNQEPVRLLGIRTAKLTDEAEPVQLSLFDMEFPHPTSSNHHNIDEEKQKKLDAALDNIRKRYGNTAIERGSEMIKNRHSPSGEN